VAVKVIAAVPASMAVNLGDIVTVMFEVTVKLNSPLIAVMAGCSESITWTCNVKGPD
jgi:hypothetical protein